MKLLGTREAREFDRLAIEKYGLTLERMMGEAGNRVAEATARLMDDEKLGTVSIFCGPGNNGGDGRVAAKALEKKGLGPFVVEIGDDLDEALESELLVDALFGFGLNRAIKGDALDAVEGINESESLVLSVDLPSGMNADGRVFGECVQADETITLAFPKKAFASGVNRDIAGRIWVGDISAPPGLYKEFGIDREKLFGGEKIIEFR